MSALVLLVLAQFQMDGFENQVWGEWRLAKTKRSLEGGK